MFGLKPDSHIHFIGVGGIGMSALAEVFIAKGYKVSGSDKNANSNTDRLEGLGLDFFNSHQEQNIEGANLIVFSSAIREQNEERVAAVKANIPLIHRGKALATLHNEAFGFAISGSHGKTTTTSITLSLMHHLNLAPTGVVGGIVKEFGSNALVGAGKYFVAEADESDGSFLHFKPQIAVVTNIDSDHLDHYKTLDKIKESFKAFIGLVGENGVFIFNKEDQNSEGLVSDSVKSISFGLSSSADYYAKNIISSEAGAEFDLCFKSEVYQTKISLSGEHNVLNSLAAIASVHQVHPKLAEISKALAKFGGAGRRFDIIYKSESLVVVDDYAHHPTEIRATINSFKERYKDRDLKIIFEPHRYTRTKDFWNEFVEVFDIDEEVYISELYPAGEDPIQDIDSHHLISAINSNSRNAYFLASWDELQNQFNLSKETKCAILVLGAGPISVSARNQVERWTTAI